MVDTGVDCIPGLQVIQDFEVGCKFPCYIKSALGSSVSQRVYIAEKLKN